MSPIDQFLEWVGTHHRILLVAGPIVLLFVYLVLKAIFRPKTEKAPEAKKRRPPEEPRSPAEIEEKAQEQTQPGGFETSAAEQDKEAIPPAPAPDPKPAAGNDIQPSAAPPEPTTPTEPTSGPEQVEASDEISAPVETKEERRSDTFAMEEVERQPAGVRTGSAGAAPDAEIAIREAPAADDDMVPEREDGHYLVDIFFATDRNRSFERTEIFSGDRHPGEFLSFGSLKISVPLPHQVGEVEQPGWWHVLLGVDADPNRFFTIQDIEDYEERAFFERLDVFQRERGAQEAFLFIHGYNNNFVDAAFRAGQIAFDMRFRGAGLLYSWPSEGRLTSYYSDAENAKWTVPHLEDFLMKLAAVPSIKVLHLIAHSMGNQALAAALENLSLSGTVPAFNQIVLTAPDIDAGVFAQISRRIVNAAERVTLYASENDRALLASRQFTSYPRLGDISDGVFVLDGIDTIDASNVDTDILGHGYFAKNRTVLSDIDRLFSLRQPPGQRKGLDARQTGDGRTYWVFNL